MRFFALLLFLCFGQVWAEDRDLLFVINFPQNYDYVPNFDDGLLAERLGDYRGSRLMLVGGGDRVLSDDDSEILSSATNLQLQRSESLRLARRRAIWVRERLVDLGFAGGDLRLGILTESVDDSVAWGGVVEVYVIE